MVEKKVAPAVEVVSSSGFECTQCEFKTQDLSKMLEHERGNQHVTAFGNYQCSRCKKVVTIVPDYIDKPAPDSGLPQDNTNAVHKKFLMVKKRPSLASTRGNVAFCDDCKAVVRKEVE